MRATCSAPGRMCRATRPSLARRVSPAKRGAEEEPELTSRKRRRLHEPVPPTPSPLRSSSGSVMSLSELTTARPTKWARVAVAIENVQSSSGKPGALAHSLSSACASATDDKDTLETPNLAVGSPGRDESDVWVKWPPRASTQDTDTEMGSPFDDDVEMEEAGSEDDVEMKDVDVWMAVDEDEVMADWADEDVMMEEIT
ncbi:hypothetical protein BN14_09290 [Rhizoctonia solani AG-1 IB]|uniref:Uncharacterized protein n=1 Tax=Thanatephorus cucumeris (strain AG1-IB / isolate 7/3/14) TaxID=1108050 RepID=M5C7Z5_THACB|nr:hypothetical protein BN14_09290 [Rhizoctonia solani AG-1 IB]